MLVKTGSLTRDRTKGKWLIMDSNLLVVSNQITVFAGYMSDVGLHSHYTAVLVFSLDGEPIGVGGSEAGWTDHTQYFLHPDERNKMRNYDHPIGCVFFEPEGSLYPLFVEQKRLGNDGLVNYMESVDELVELIVEFSKEPSGADEFIRSVVRCLMGREAIEEVSSKDSRVVEVLNLIKADPGANTSAAQLASRINISERQLSTLFKRQVGVPIRRYRQWLRLKQVARFALQGLNLTDAALDAGFSDSAHFSNTCRKTLGVKPTDLLLGNKPLMLIACSDCC